MTQEIASKSLNLLYERMRADENLRAKVVFFGGEPLMNWPLLEWACKDIAAQDFVGRISKMLITNGTLLTRDLAMLLRQHDVYVVVSLDGRPAINDSVRQAPDGSGSYGAVSVGIDCLQETMPGRFGISCTVGRHNATSLPEEIAYLQEQFQPRSIGLNIYHYQNDGTSPIEENASTMCKALLDVFRMARSEGIVIYQFLSILRSFVRRERNRDYCAACADKLVVTPRGTVGRCEALMFNERYCVSLDEYREDPNPSALDWSSFTPRVENDCQECASRWICPGGCVYDSIVRSGIVRGTEQRRCMFMKMMLQELLSILLSEVLKTEPEREIVIPTKHHFERLLGQMEISLLDAY